MRNLKTFLILLLQLLIAFVVIYVMLAFFTAEAVSNVSNESQFKQPYLKARLVIPKEPKTPLKTHSVASYKAYARKGLPLNQWNCLNTLWERESNWKPEAQNPRSTAYGIAQFIDSTWKHYGEKTSDPYLQIDYGLLYIKDRYGTPCNALYFHNLNNYY